VSRQGWLVLVASACAVFLTLLVPLGSASTSGADATLSSNSLTFSARPAGTRSDAQTVTLTNNGDAPLAIQTVRVTGPDADDFGQGVDCPIVPSTLSAGGSCKVYVSFRPSSAGPKSATLAIGDNAPSTPQTIALGGEGVAGGAGVATLSQTSVTFHEQVAGTKSNAQGVTLTNTGSGPLTISTLRFSGPDAADFSQGVDCPISPDSLPAGAHCTVYVAFTPDSAGPKSATLAIGDDDPSSPQTIALSGNGTVGAGVAAFAPTSLTFADRAVGTRSDAQLVRLTNTGGGPLTISTVRVTGPNAVDFSQGIDCPINPDSLAAGASCSIYVAFTPSATGAETATLTIGDDAPTSPQTIALSGGGTSPAQLTITPDPMDFGAQTVGSSSAVKTMTLTNVGGQALLLNSVTVGGANPQDFTASWGCSAILSHGNTCNVQVTFKPTATGTRTATLVVDDTAPGSPQTAVLTGTGTQPAAPVASFSPTAVDFGDQRVGTTSAARTVTLTNTGTLPMSIGSVAITGAAGTEFARTTSCGTSLDVGASCTIDVIFTPAAAGAHTAKLSVSGNQANNPATVALSGNAPMPTGTLFSDGFESGLGQWSVWTCCNAVLSTAGTPHTGSHAAFFWQAGPGPNMYATFPGQGQAQTHTRFWYSLGNQFATELAQGTTASGQPVWEIDHDPRLGRLSIYVWNSSGVRTDTYVNFAPGTAWQGFDVDLLQAVAGHFRVSINGTTVASVNGNFSAANNYSRLGFWDTSAYGSISLDDVSVSTS
jgi:HYDIN/CFA65/VesB family protein